MNMIKATNISKSFTLHQQSGVVLNVFSNLSLDVNAGECVGLVGPSGMGKSTILRMIYGNYRTDEGSILVNNTEIVGCDPQTILGLRRTTMGFVSQFLRVLPRVPAIDVVSEPMRRVGHDAEEARQKASYLLESLNIPENLWRLSPSTFSGGEQQRINIARGLCHPYPVLLLDEPTASLDKKNKKTVLSLINGAKDAGAAILGIFHDDEARKAVCDRMIDIRELCHMAGEVT